MKSEPKENYYRKVIIENISEDNIGLLSSAYDWKYCGTETINGKVYHVFANEDIDMKIYFRYKNSFVSTNVLPIDAANINRKEYLLGGDSAEQQADDITEDILYDFCIKINSIAHEVNERKDQNIWCAIVPSVHDMKEHLEKIK